MIEVKNLVKITAPSGSSSELSVEADVTIYGFLTQRRRKITTGTSSPVIWAPQRARVIIDGHDMVEQKHRNRRVPPLYMDMTVIGSEFAACIKNC